MKPAFLITNVHCNLPKNRKQAEIERFFRSLISTTLTQQEYDKLLEDIRVAVSFLNSKYPKTAEYYINTYDKCISVCASGGDKSVYLTFEPIGNSYTEQNRVINNGE